MKSTTQSRRRRGVCTGCGGKVQPQYTMCDPCLSIANERNKARYRKWVRDGICVDCKLKRPFDGKLRCEVCRKIQAKKSKSNFHKLKEVVFAAYGGYVCACCQETTKEFLTVDHIHGGGSKHRKEVGSGCGFYAWLKRNKFPSGFQILCMNCQWGKKNNNNVCPHKAGTEPPPEIETEPRRQQEDDNLFSPRILSEPPSE